MASGMRGMSEARARRVLAVSAVLTGLGLGFMLWSLLVPTALPVVLAMSLGQGLGTLAFALFGWVVVSDLRTKRAEPAEPTERDERDERDEPPSSGDRT